MTRADCPGGNGKIYSGFTPSEIFIFTGKYGFNTYNLLTSVVLGFNAVSNLYANLNNNNNERLNNY